MEINEGDILEYTGPKQTAMTIGKSYKVWGVISYMGTINHSVIVKNDLNQWQTISGAHLEKAPMITDSGAAEYEEIMASIGETEP